MQRGEDGFDGPFTHQISTFAALLVLNRILMLSNSAAWPHWNRGRSDLPDLTFFRSDPPREFHLSPRIRGPVGEHRTAGKVHRARFGQAHRYRRFRKSQSR